MPGRDITRLLNKSQRILFPLLFLLSLCVGQSVLAAAQDKNESKDAAASSEPAKQETSDKQQASKPAESTPPPSSQPQDNPPDKGDSGVFVFRKNVDEVMLHATVVDDKQRIVTTLDKSAFTVFEDGKPQSIISF